jgi:hypothetical protein
MSPRVLRVTEPAKLDWILARGRRRAAHVALELDALDVAERVQWEKRINRDYRACGCGSGALALVLALVGGAGAAVAHPELVFAHPVWLAVLAPLVLLAALGTGKAVGLRLARLQLERTVALLRQRLTSRPAAIE